MSDITVSSGCKIHSTADIFSGCQRKFLDLTIQISLDTCFNICGNLLSVLIEDFDSIIIKRIMACGNHDTAVKIFCTYHIGYTWSCGYMKQIGICSGCGKSCRKGILKHVTASSCILADHDLRLVISAVIPAEITSHTKCMICCKFYICFTTKTICSEIFTHNVLLYY